MLNIRKFFRDETGSLSIEALLCFPLVSWCLAASLVFWDAYYAKSINMRAAYTIGDMISRETGEMDDAYMEGMNDVLNFIMKGRYESRMRVTVITPDMTDAEFAAVTKIEDMKYSVEWSYASEGFNGQLTNASLVNFEGQLPYLAKGDVAIMVETNVGYTPFFDVGLGNLLFADLTVTRPRISPQLKYKAPDGTVYEADGDPDSLSDDGLSPIDDPDLDPEV